jgi:hypothetical protein
VREVSRGEGRVTEGVGAEKWRGIRLAVSITAATPSDSPSASHLPQEEGLGLRRFASGGGIVGLRWACCAIVDAKEGRELGILPEMFGEVIGREIIQGPNEFAKGCRSRG